jgi:hypothetical protein
LQDDQANHLEALMQQLCWRAGAIATTAGALVLLSVAGIAVAKGPPEGVGGGKDTATVVPLRANVKDTPPGQLRRPDRASKPVPPGQAKPSGEPATPAAPRAGGKPVGEVSHPDRGTSRHGNKRQGPAAPAPTAAVGKPSSEPLEGLPGSPDERGSSGPPDLLPRPDARKNGHAGVAGAVTGEAVELPEDASPAALPEDASPATLPFTGLQLALLVLAGMAAVATGSVLRRTVRQ